LNETLPQKMFAKAPTHTTSIIKMEHVAGGQKIDD